VSSYLRKFRGLPKEIYLYNLAWGFIGFAIFGLAGVLANLYLLRLGYSPGLIGQIQGVGQLVWAASALPASMLGMRFGMKKMLTLGTTLVGLFYILFITAAYLPSLYQIPVTFIALGGVFLGAALSLVCGIPYISSVTHPEERNAAFAMNGAFSTGAGVLGSLVAGLLPGWLATLTLSSLEEALPYRLSLVFVPILMLVAAFIQSRMQAEQKIASSLEPGVSNVIPLKVFLFFGMVVFLQAASEGGVRAFYNIYMDVDLHAPMTAIGTIFSLAGLVSIFGALIMPELISRFGSRGAFGLVSLSAAVMLVVMGALPNLMAASFSFICLGLIFAVGGAVRNVLSQEIVQPYWRSATSAILILGFALGWACMALLGGIVMASYRFNGLIFICAGVAILSALLMMTYMLMKRKAAQIPVGS
jgi:MFS family permease